VLLETFPVPARPRQIHRCFRVQNSWARRRWNLGARFALLTPGAWFPGSLLQALPDRIPSGRKPSAGKRAGEEDAALSADPTLGYYKEADGSWAGFNVLGECHRQTLNPEPAGLGECH